MNQALRKKPKAGEYAVDYQPGKGWIVIDPLGKTDGRSFGNRNAALVSVAAAKRKAEKLAGCISRACITCGTSFPSQGPHNRMCTSCRHKNPDEQSQTPYIAKGRR